MKAEELFAIKYAPIKKDDQEHSADNSARWRRRPDFRWGS